MNLPPDIVASLQQAVRKPGRRWWQMSLRSIFILVTLAGVAACFHETLQPYVDWWLELLHLKTRPIDGCGPCGLG